MTTTAPTFTAIPDIDLARWAGTDADRAALAAETTAICHELGFFHVVGHGVPDSFRLEWDDALRAFFALPEDVKATHRQDASRRTSGAGSGSGPS